MTDPRSGPELLRRLRSLPQGPSDSLVEVRPLTAHIDERGILVPLDLSELPFQARRLFCITKVDSPMIRGCHGHKSCWQAWLCLTGEVTIEGTNGSYRFAHTLTEQSEILIMPPGIWSLQHCYSTDAVVLVVASHSYDEQDYFFEMDGGS
ncbi:MAG: FdtA/QdtA family cupin domain-containing protein [Coriobacteriia bacterium]|nr:FdtA/QdtA family cupin domain-containing protein [Coriobacteriia bacterium]